MAINLSSAPEKQFALQIQKELRRLNHIEQIKNPRKCHRKLCQWMLQNWYNDKQTAGEVVDANFDEIVLLKENERNRLVQAIPFEIVRDAIEIKNNCTGQFMNAQAKKFQINQLIEQGVEKVPISVLRKWAYTYIWEKVKKGEEQHPYERFHVMVSNEKVMLSLETLTAEPMRYLRLEYIQREGGCELSQYGVPLLVEGMDFKLLAANEIIEILKYSIGPNPKVTLPKFLIDIGYWRFQTTNDADLPRLEFDHPTEYPDVSVFQNVRRWLDQQKTLDPDNVVYANDFDMNWIEHGADEIQPFLLDYLQPVVLETISLRAWNLERDERYVPINESTLHRFSMTDQWFHAKHIYLFDVRGEADFLPVRLGSTELYMSKLTKNQVLHIAEIFRDKFPPEPCVVHAELPFMFENQTSSYHLPLLVGGKSGVQVLMNRTDATFKYFENSIITPQGHIRSLARFHQNMNE